MKQIIRLTESDLHRIVKESVNKILSEGLKGFTYDPSTGEYYDKYGNTPEYDENGEAYDPYETEEDQYGNPL